MAMARQADHTLGRQLSRVRVLVDVRTPMNVSVLRPLWLPLAHDSRVVLSFAAEQPASVRATLAEDGLERNLMARGAAKWTRWDLAIAADAWNHASLHRCRRTMLFFHGVAGKYDLDSPSRLRAAALERFDRVAFINRDRLQRYVEAGVVSAQQAVLVGYPKLDDLLNGRYDGPAILRSLRLDALRPTVLYAPTFSTASSLHRAGPSIIETLLGLDVNVIVKLHDRSMIPDPRHTDRIDWPRRLAPYERSGRLRLARTADASPFLAASNVLVTDHSTVGFEFALLDRPLVVFDAPDLLDAARIAPERWHALRQMADVVRTTSELAEAVRSALSNPGRLRTRRHGARALFAHPGVATGRALEEVYHLLDLPQPIAPAREQRRLTATVRARG
jgi:hypothetical protein